MKLRLKCIIFESYANFAIAPVAISRSCAQEGNVKKVVMKYTISKTLEKLVDLKHLIYLLI